MNGQNKYLAHHPHCLAHGCQNPIVGRGPRFARLLCEECRQQIPAGLQLVMEMQELQIDALAEQADILRELLWEMDPERLVAQMSRASDEKLFLEVNFGDRLIGRILAGQQIKDGN